MSISFNAKEGLIVVPARLSSPVGDVLVRLALDTGATRSLVAKELLTLIGCDAAASIDRVDVLTGSGVESIRLVKIPTVEALGEMRTDFSVFFHTLPVGASVDGVLGLDFLRGTRLLIDFVDGVITIKSAT